MTDFNYSKAESAGMKFYDNHFEEDEDPEKIRRIWEHGTKGETGRPVITDCTIEPVDDPA